MGRSDDHKGHEEDNSTRHTPGTRAARVVADGRGGAGEGRALLCCDRGSGGRTEAVVEEVVRRVTAVVEALLRGLSPEAQAAVTGGVAGGVIGGLVGGVFAIIGVVLGLIGEPWLRRRGDVRCDIARDAWQIIQGTQVTPLESQFEVTFWNGKEIPIAVMGVRMEFYKGTTMLEERARPDLLFATGDGNIAPTPVNLPAREAVIQTITVVAGTEHKQRELAETDRAVFVASVVGARDERKELVPPWRP